MVKESFLLADVTSNSHADADLIRQVRAGDAASFGPLVAKYQDRVYNACWRICGHAEDARDLTQEAFIKAYESMDSFAGQSGFYTWLFRIAVNLSISHRRKTSRRVTMPLTHEPDSWSINRQAAGLAGARNGDGDPAHKAGRTETHAQVVAALNELDVDQRAVVVLKDIEDLDYEQIASILSVPKGTVKSRIHRARMALREKLQGMLDA